MYSTSNNQDATYDAASPRWWLWPSVSIHHHSLRALSRASAQVFQHENNAVSIDGLPAVRGSHPSNRSSQEASRTRLTMRCPSVMSRLSCASDTSQRPSGSMTWAKYSKPMNATPQLTDPNTKQPPTTNLFYSVDYGTALPNFGSTIQELVKTESISRSAKWRHAGWLAASRRTRVWMPTPSIRSLSRTRSRTAISCPQECWL